ncbi:MAG: DUF2934 domain-containing protein [Alphaproteobacteria bacterium]|nr:DUF2934 domain-containing protein [Alphaproteobacteria bacterium]
MKRTHAPKPDEDRSVRERAYYIWEREGRPEGRAREHWLRAVADAVPTDHDADFLADQEAIVEGLPADLPAVLTKDARGG